MRRPRAAIDIGTHTARLLVASDLGPSGQLRSLVRKRAYIRLAGDFDCPYENIIQPDAIDRTLKVLYDFLHHIKAFNVHSIHAIATGVVRDAVNREEFLGRIQEQTGIGVSLIKGDEEAHLTAKGVLHALGVQKKPCLIFDLGGGSTEFFFEGKGIRIAKSTPLGAMVLTKEHLKSDPPEESQVNSLSEYIDHCLNKPDLEFLRRNGSLFVAGTGGTVTTLALMLHGIAHKNISAEQINGLVIERPKIEALFDKIRTMRFEERLNLRGLDQGRAGIILAGSLVVLRILHCSKSFQLTVSLSDLLEGILIKYFEGGSNG